MVSIKVLKFQKRTDDARCCNKLLIAKKGRFWSGYLIFGIEAHKIMKFISIDYVIIKKA